MQDRGAGERYERIVYCLVPEDLAPALHDVLRKHFLDDSSVEVVVERRSKERRSGSDRRAESDGTLPAPDRERRRIRSVAGRRAGDRRAVQFEVPARGLPRKARAHAERLIFVERLEPSSQHDEDADSARLVVSIQSGDKDAFAVLYMRYFDRVYGYLRVLLQDAHLAEDLTQRVFISALEALPRYEGRAPFRGWLFTIVRNEAVSELRRRRRLDVHDPAMIDRHRESVLDGDEENLAALDWISDRELMMFVERLPLIQRQVLFLRFRLDMSHSEIGRLLGRSSEDVRNLQSRALRFIRARLTALGRGPRRVRRPLRRRVTQAPVLRMRRFALFE
jgi:RNA polymerase sigma-70 factor (ECF subfamily)